MNATKIKMIVTHPGKAHRDEFLALCVLLSDSPDALIRRREPTEEELCDPLVAVVDIGGRFNPQLNNWDHHQLPREADATCAAQMVIEHIHGPVVAHELYPWLRLTGILDSKGPGAAASHLGVSSPTAFFETLSPIEGYILRVFAECERYNPGGEMHTMMRQIGWDLQDKANQLEDAKAQHHMETRLVHGLPVIWVDRADRKLLDEQGYVVDVDDTPHKMLTSAIHSLRNFCCSVEADLPAPEIIAVSVSPDDRGPGYSLYRFEDDSRVDFSRVAEDPRVSFAHPGGFIAKTVPGLKTEDLEEILQLAMV